MERVMREGGGLCGALRYYVKGEPDSSGICHCESCRRAASAPRLPYAVFARDRFAFSRGQPAEYNSSPKVTRRFCGTCCSPLTYRTVDAPDRIDVMTCSLDDPGSVIPSCHVWVSEKVSWDQVAGDLAVYPTFQSAGL